MPKSTPSKGKPDTRERLLAASLKAFGHNDYQAVSTRQIVELAQANISAISYHFGGKHELYLATADYLAQAIRASMAETLNTIRARSTDASPDTGRELLTELVRAFTHSILQGELSADAAGFIFREQLDPTDAFDILYRELMEPMQATYAGLLGGILGRDPQQAPIKLLTHSLMGQIMIFRLAQTTIQRRLGVDRFDDADTRAITDMILQNTFAAIDARLLQDDLHDN